MKHEDCDDLPVAIASDGVTKYSPGSICVIFSPEINEERRKEIIDTIGGQLLEGFGYNSPALVLSVLDGEDEKLVLAYNSASEVIQAMLNTCDVSEL